MEGKAYIDDTDAETMKAEREQMESKNRNNSCQGVCLEPTGEIFILTGWVSSNCIVILWSINFTLQGLSSSRSHTILRVKIASSRSGYRTITYF